MLYQSLIYVTRFKNFFKSLCACPRGYSNRVKIIGDTPLTWYARVPEHCIVLDCIENETCESYALKYKVWYHPEKYTKTSDSESIKLLNTKVKAPWVWIGGKDVDNKQIDATDMLSHYLLRNNLIKLELLEKLDPRIIEWSYMDYETLDIVNFPIEGILIRE
jgi:hypothetical protein